MMDARELKRIVGYNVRKERLLHDLTQSDLAELIGVSLKQITAIETGKAYPRPATMAALCKVLDTSPSTFFHTGNENDDEKKRLNRYGSHIMERLGEILAEEAAEYGGNES